MRRRYVVRWRGGGGSMGCVSKMDMGLCVVRGRDLMVLLVMGQG